MSDADLHNRSDSSSAVMPRSRWQRLAKWLLICLLLLVAFVALALGAFTVVMARTPEYRAQVQAWLSERARLDIQFDGLSAGWRLYGPELVFTQAVVRSSDGERVLARAERGGVGFDIWKALRTWRLSAARFSLQGTELKLQRRTDGTFEFVGQADWPEFESSTEFKLDSLPVGELAVSDVRLSFRDLKTGRGPWVLDHVALDITRGSRVFDLQGSADLPATLGKRLEFAAHGEGNLNDVAQLRWRAQVSGTEFDLSGWQQIMPKDWVAPAQGKGSFLLQATLLGPQLQQYSGHLDFVEVQLALPDWSMPLPTAEPLRVRDDVPQPPPDAPPVAAPVAATTPAASPQLRDVSLTYQNIGVQFSGARTGQGWLTRFDRLQLAREAAPWPAGKANLLLKFAESATGSRLSKLQADAQLVVLDNLWPLLAYLPETERNARLRALNATGRLSGLTLQYEHEDEQAAPRFDVRVEFAQVGVSPVGRAPGVSGLSGVVSATGERGELKLDSHDLALSLPSLFRTPLPVDQVAAHISWQRNADGIQLRSDDLSVSNADGRAQARFTLELPAQGSPVIDMRATLNDLNAAAAPRYMPAGVMHRQTLAWLDAAFPAGTVKHADATLQGPLYKFPFRGNEGLFLINAQIEGLQLDYQPGWIPATDLRVDAEFRNVGLSAVATAGRVNGLHIDRAEGRIKDYRQAEVFIKAQAHGDLANGLTFVQQSPVGPMIGNIFQQLTGRGALQGSADLYFPLTDLSRRKLDIKVALRDSALNMNGVPQGIEQLGGTLRIFNDSVVGADLRGRFLQSDFIARTEPVARGRYNVVATGSAQAQPLAQFLKLPAWLKLEGATAYRYVMPGYGQRDGNGVRRLYSVASDLRGLAINLPAPVNKPANVARNLQIDAELRGNDMLLRGALGPLRGLVRLQERNGAWSFDRAGLRADGIAAALPAHSGLRIDGRLEEFELDDWLKLDTGRAVVTAATKPVRLQDILRAANVSIGKFHLYGFEWPEVRGVLQATDAGWRVDVAGMQASGQVVVPYDFASGRALTLDMESLRLTSAASVDTPAGQRRGTPLDPRDLPAIRADIKRFIYGEHDFGALQMVGVRTPQGLQVNTLNISGDSFNGVGSGSWLHTASGQQNSLKLALESRDVRATMQQLNYGDFIAAKRGKLIADLIWPGGLDEDLLGRASGTLEFQVDEGQLLNVQPGAGRVLGLLSVAALPRRLGLDFRDVTDKGLAFDSIHADFTVQNGDARTQNLLLRGPTAEIGMVGRMGLGVRDYDQTAVVTGDVSAALPVAGTVAGGPVVGAALLLFSQIFKEPLKGVARAYYHIGGSWDDPQIERIDSDAGKASLSGADSSLVQ